MSYDNFRIACFDRNIDAINLLIDKGLDDNSELYGYSELSILNTKWNEGLAGACQGGHMDIVHLIIEKASEEAKEAEEAEEAEGLYWNWGLSYASRGGHMDIVLFMIEKGANDWNWAFDEACHSGHMDIALFMLEKIKESKSEIDWDDSLVIACQGGHMNMVLLAIENGACVWGPGFEGACEGGNLDIVHLMIEKNSTIVHDFDWNEGLAAACNYGHMDIILFMISQGADKWANSLVAACYSGNINIVHLMIEKIESSPEHNGRESEFWHWALVAACERDNNMDIALLMLSKGADTVHLSGKCREMYYNMIKVVINQMNISDCGGIVYEFINPLEV